MANNTAYVCDRVGAQLVAMDLVAFTQTAIAVGNGPQFCAIKPDGSEVWVANTTDSSISVVDVPTSTVTHTITVGIPTSPVQLGFSRDGSACYVTQVGGTGITPIDTATYLAGITLPTTYTPTGFLAMDPVADDLAAIIESSGGSPDSWQQMAIPGGAVSSVFTNGITNQAGLCYSADGTLLFIVERLNTAIEIWTTSPIALVTTRTVGVTPWFVVTPNIDGSRIYFANSTELYYLTVPGLVVTAGVAPLGVGPKHGIAVTGDNTQLVLTDESNGAVYVYSQPGLVLQHTFTGVTTQPWGVCCTPHAPGQIVMLT